LRLHGLFEVSFHVRKVAIQSGLGYITVFRRVFFSCGVRLLKAFCRWQELQTI